MKHCGKIELTTNEEGDREFLKREDLKKQMENPEFIQAVILGELTKSFNKIQVGKYNKLAIEFNLDKENKAGIEYLLDHVNKDEYLRGVYHSAINGKIETQVFRDLEKQSGSLHNTVSAYVIENTEVQANNREFNKFQREGAYLNHLVDGMHKTLLEELDSLKITNYVDPGMKIAHAEGKKELIVCLADWHIGALVNNMDTGGYNFETFKKRLNELVYQVVEKIHKENIEKVHVYHIGDVIEHINMRNVNQAFEAEFPATEQISKGIRCLVEALNTIADTETEVTFGIVGGNHDRFQGNKADKIYNDNVAYLVLDNLFFLQGFKGLAENITLIDNRKDVYQFFDQVAGKTIKVVHGDHEGKKVDVKIPKHIKDKVIDYLILGHIHTTRIIQEDFDRFHVYVGSTMGANNYSAENNLPTTSPAQMMLTLDPEQDSPVFQPVFL